MKSSVVRKSAAAESRDTHLQLVSRRPAASSKSRTPGQNMVRDLGHRALEGFGVVLAVCAVYVLLALVSYSPADPSLNHAADVAMVANWGGWLGAYLADTLYMIFGLGAFGVVLGLAFYANNALTHRPATGMALQIVTVPLMLLSFGVLMAVYAPFPNWPYAGAQADLTNGGLLGKMLATLLVPLLGRIGCTLIMGAMLVLAVLWFTGWTLRDVRETAVYLYKMTHVGAMVMLRQLRRLRENLKTVQPAQFDLPLAHPMPQRPRLMPLPSVAADTATATAPVIHAEKAGPEPRQTPRVSERQVVLPLGDTPDGHFVLPPLDLLDKPKGKKGVESGDALTQNARRIEAELRNFGVEGKVTNIRPGPVITIYELEPAPGVKTSTVVGLQDDLARAMSAFSIRIAPMPGRTVLGIEVPNRDRQFLSLRELIDTNDFENEPSKLCVAMGVDTTGQPVYTDIAKMPHALVAGTTGSGKSVAINAFILSLLYRMTPDELKMVMVDPKMLELSIYNDIPHLVTPVITDPNKAAAALNWVVKEMENRYRMMSDLGVKNLASFNAKFNDMQAEGKVPTKLVQTGFDIETGQPRFEDKPIATKPLPHIVVVIDELADLMMVAGKAVEFSIARLTQMARASGIHLLVATQRPSVDVVTGLIKANIPTRISFSVASKIDSRTVLDSMGAETLLGKGDMLYLGNGSNAIQRLHGAFVSEEECTRVADYWKAQATPSYIEDIFKAGVAVVPGSKQAKAAEAEGETDGEGGEDLYKQAVDVVTREGKASTSFLQRNLKIGYNRAADLIDRMEGEGLISAPNHVGKREVLARR